MYSCIVLGGVFESGKDTSEGSEQGSHLYGSSRHVSQLLLVSWRRGGRRRRMMRSGRKLLRCGVHLPASYTLPFSFPLPSRLLFPPDLLTYFAPFYLLTDRPSARHPAAAPPQIWAAILSLSNSHPRQLDPPPAEPSTLKWTASCTSCCFIDCHGALRLRSRTPVNFVLGCKLK